MRIDLPLETAAAARATERPAGPLFQRLPVVLPPHRNLLAYYALASFLLGPLFFILLVPLYFRYHTLRYEVDDEGITMRWGILFRREISLTYARIQDIHLMSNVVERWLGLGRILVQTASGSARAEMTVEGVREFEAMRDFLYSRMRGAKGGAAVVEGREPPAEGADELAATLRAIAAEVRELRLALAPATAGAGAGAGAPGRAPAGPPAPAPRPGGEDV